MERSIPGANAWTLAGTSCGDVSPIVVLTNKYLVPMTTFFDALGGIIPGATYLYRVTALAANGEAGSHTVPWTAPDPVILRWLSATVTGSTVTLRARYEPPASNAPVSPSSVRVTTLYGANQTSSGYCSDPTGCSFVLTAVPSGTHRFTMLAEWTRLNPTTGGPGAVIATVSADTTIIVP
jgi:hypothetical protein